MLYLRHVLMTNNTSEVIKCSSLTYQLLVIVCISLVLLFSVYLQCMYATYAWLITRLKESNLAAYSSIVCYCLVKLFLVLRHYILVDDCLF